MNPRDEKWPIEKEFFVEIEDHSEDGSWFGYAHSDEFPRGSDSRKAVLVEPDNIQVPRELWEELKHLWKQVPGKGTKQAAEALNLIEKAGL